MPQEQTTQSYQYTVAGYCTARWGWLLFKVFVEKKNIVEKEVNVREMLTVKGAKGRWTGSLMFVGMYFKTILRLDFNERPSEIWPRYAVDFKIFNAENCFS